MTLPLRELQQSFAAGILRDDPAVLTHVHGGRSGAARLFRVYRHNAAASLTDALAAVYPVIKRLVGAGFFEYAADRYWHARPPASGNIHDFGDAFPDFLAGFEPACELVYLPDVARLEWAWHRAFHSPDPPPLDRDRLRTVDPADYQTLRFLLHPSARLIDSRWPVLHIWKAHQSADEPETIDLAVGGECLLVIRRGFDVALEPLAPGEYALLSAFADGLPLAAACGAALDRQPDADIAGLLQRHVDRSTITGLIVDRQPDIQPSEKPHDPD